MAAWGQTRVNWLTLRHEGKGLAITLKIATLFIVKVNPDFTVAYRPYDLYDPYDLYADTPKRPNGQTPTRLFTARWIPVTSLYSCLHVEKRP
jgi:hypothetical protein